MTTQIDLYCDGACSGNPGPGGYAFTLIAWNRDTEAALKTLHGSGYALHTTHQQMELTAAFEGLKALTQPATLRVISDSQYLVRGMTEWITRWQQNGWRNTRKMPIANHDLWLELHAAAQAHTITWVWTKGHTNSKNRFSGFNNLVDEEAAKQRDSARRLATGRVITVARAFALAESGSDDLSVFHAGKLVALNGAIVERIVQTSADTYMIDFQTFARESTGDDPLYELP